MKPVALVLALGLAASAQAAPIYNCGGTYQQVPCDGGEIMDVRPASGHADPSAAEDSRRRLSRLQQRNRISEAIERRLPMAGMTHSELQRAMGPAARVNDSVIGGVAREQIIFERPDGTWYVYTEDGIVSSYQHTEAINRSRGARRPCPSSLDIREVEMEARSAFTPPDRRVELQRQIEKMRACL